MLVARKTEGFERVGNLAGFPANPRKYELTPGVAFQRGDLVALDGGRLVKAGPSATRILGVMAETIAAEDNPAGKTTYGAVYDHPMDIFRASIVNHFDGVADGGTTTTLVDAALPSAVADGYVGATLYIYEGPGAGAVRIVVGYDATNKVLTVNEPFPEAPTTATKYVLIGAGTTAKDGIHAGALGVQPDANGRSIDAGAATGGGALTVLAVDPKNLTCDVLIADHQFA